MEGVEGVTEPLEIGRRRLGHDVDVEGPQGNTLQSPGEASEHDVLHVVGVEDVADGLDLAGLFVVSRCQRTPPGVRLRSRTAAIRAQYPSRSIC